MTAFVDLDRQAFAVAQAERRLGRPLTRAERAVDIVAIDRDLTRAKLRLATLIDARKRTTIRARLRGSHFRLDLTDEMVGILRGLAAKGRAHALAEMRRLGIRPRFAEREFAASPGLDRATSQLAGLLANLDATVAGRTDVAVDRATSDAGVPLDLSELSRTSAVRAVLSMGGPLDVSSRVVSTALYGGVGDVFSENAGLFGGFMQTAVMDEATCDPCAEADGTEFASWEDAQDSMPDGGPFVDCDGEGRCRCRLVPLDADEAAVGDGGGPVPEQPTTEIVDPVVAALEGSPGLLDLARYDLGQSGIERYARLGYSSLGRTTPETYAEAAAGAVREATANAEVRVRVHPDGLRSILEDGRFKSQFETKTSSGKLDNAFRASAERSMFGYPQDLPASERPIYGYLKGPGEKESAAWINMYGEIVVRMKPELRARATFSLDDSLGINMVPQSLVDPVDPLLAVDWAQDPLATWEESRSLDAMAGAYPEAQIHGGVSVADIEEVVLQQMDAEPSEFWQARAWKAEADLERAEPMLAKLREEHPAIADDFERDFVKPARDALEEANFYIGGGDRFAELKRLLDERGVRWRMVPNLNDPLF